ncbi:Ectonucleoside triphosphate diphosphohydrolase 7 [Merluccius polli]|uniref:Ectonucleoside triphosphate diphosphohydrolase 7 n=1 Tax=Merluccius polli TaxID=89951 RepID=A0AA47MBL3_MERPO|nr:Ectonucleoside triphosphate diphosphohydrolase 7 [Merluccius polli]
MEATDLLDPALNYGVVVDWSLCTTGRPTTGTPTPLLDIRQMKDRERKPVVKKIIPARVYNHDGREENKAHCPPRGYLTSQSVHAPLSMAKTPEQQQQVNALPVFPPLAQTPEKASIYLQPLLSFAAAPCPPRPSTRRRPLYILCTAGMRLLPDRRCHGRGHDGGPQQPAANQPGGVPFGIRDIGRGHLSDSPIEVPSAVTFSSPQEGLEPSTSRCVWVCGRRRRGKSLLAEFNLGCDVEKTQHVYRVYVTTFLGFGGNMARQRYEDLVVNSTWPATADLPRLYSRLLGSQTGLSQDNPSWTLPAGACRTRWPGKAVPAPAGPRGLEPLPAGRPPFLGLHNGTMSPRGVYQAPIDFNNSEFYGFSEFYYCMEDVLRIGGQYDSLKYSALPR